jgi:hypothetical protein
VEGSKYPTNTEKKSTIQCSGLVLDNFQNNANDFIAAEIPTPFSGIFPNS